MNSKVVIRNGRMISMFSRYEEENKLPDIQYIKCNGWTGYREKDGTLIFSCEREYHRANNTHTNISIRAVIYPDGIFKVTRKEGCEKPKILSRKKIADKVSNVSGEIILTGNNYSDRTVIFRSEWYIDFLKRHNLNSVSKMKPSEFVAIDLVNWYSDGKSELDDDTNKVSFSSDCTWAIVYTRIYDALDSGNIVGYYGRLITDRDLNDLDEELTNKGY